MEVQSSNDMIEAIEEQLKSGIEVKDPMDDLRAVTHRRAMTPKLAEEMLELMIASKLHLNKAIEIANIPHLEVIKYIMDNSEYRKQVAQVHTINAELLHQEAISEVLIADSKIGLERAKLMLSTAQWLLERLNPDTYSPRLKVEETHTINLHQIILEANQRISPIPSIPTTHKKL
jgi:hypothetical protein